MIDALQNESSDTRQDFGPVLIGKASSGVSTWLLQGWEMPRGSDGSLSYNVRHFTLYESTSTASAEIDIRHTLRKRIRAKIRARAVANAAERAAIWDSMKVKFDVSQDSVIGMIEEDILDS